MKRKRLNVLDWFAQTIHRGTYKGEKFYFESWKEMLSYMNTTDQLYGDSYLWLSKLERFLKKEEE